MTIIEALSTREWFTPEEHLFLYLFNSAFMLIYLIGYEIFT